MRNQRGIAIEISRGGPPT